MPATRRTASGEQERLKSKAVDSRALPTADSTRTYSPKNQKKDASASQKFTTSRIVQKSLVASTSSSVSNIDAGEEALSRRSGRRRTVSKRLQDMELNFGSRKSPFKRDHQGEQTDAPAKRCRRTSLSNEDDLLSHPVPKEESATRQGPLLESEELNISESTTSTNNSGSDEDGTLHEDKLAEQKRDVEKKTFRSEDKASTPEHASENDIDSSGQILSESSERIIVIMPIEDISKNTVFVEGKEIDQDSAREITYIAKADVSRSTASNESSVEKEQSNIIPDQGGVNSVRAEDASSSAVSVSGLEDRKVHSGSHIVKEDESKVFTEVVETGLQTELKSGEDDKLECLAKGDDREDVVKAVSSTDPGITVDDKVPCEPGRSSPNTLGGQMRNESETGEVNTKPIETDGENREFEQASENVSSEILLVEEDTTVEPADGERTETKAHETDEQESSHSPAHAGLEEIRQVALAEAGTQIVLLDDGRQLLLSNADTLSTLGAAESMTALAQMKDLAALFSPSGAEHAQVSSAISDGESSVQSNSSAVQKNLKVKFVTVNAPSVAQSANRIKTNPYSCHVDMVVNPERTVSSGPATILSPDGYYRCSMCKYKTDKKANWYKHRYTHMAQRRYACDKCDHKATTSSNLKRHMLIHTDVKYFKCEQCEDEFRQKIHLERHIRYKHQEKNIKCKYCDYICSNVNPDLMVHMKRRHVVEMDSDKLRYRCEDCGFVAVSKRDLKQHRKFHRPGPELKLYCEQCSFVTDCKSRLTRHSLVHSRQRPFRCGLCSYRASQKEHVLRHLRTKHNVSVGSTSIETTEQDKDGFALTIILPQEAKPAAAENTPVAHAMTNLRSLLGQTLEAPGQAVAHAQSEQAPDPVSSKVELAAQHQPGKDREGGEGCGQQIDIGDALGQLSTHSEEGESVERVPDPASDETFVSETVVESGTDTVSVVPSHTVVTIEAQALSASTSNDQEDGELGKQQKVAIGERRRYEPADFSMREKMFSCIHCTMKFSKLINLYKHLAVQHKDMQTTKPDGLHACVWCDYQTNKWKNLLVHMRKHNYREEYGTASPRYACVVCNYSSQHRKTLYAHMMKKHKIQIYIKPDGSASCLIDDTVPGTMLSAADGSAVVIQSPQGNGGGSCSSTLASPQVAAQGTEGSSELSTECRPDTQTVMIELEPGMPATAVEIMVPSRSEDVDHEAADAIEGLQALAEQVMAAQQEEQQQGQQQHSEEQLLKTAGVDNEADLEEGQVLIEEDQEGEPTTDSIKVEESTQIQIQDPAGQVADGSSIQLTQEQLMQLSSGDFIEINGEMYKVEVAEENPCS